ncbi:hypothetical protein [Pseudomonas protegens]|uniref:hypothetical protein n=1 Tax=Pseudomonas protegens TaxID=380021 RepID=UPI0011861A9C|nr:hypothetical protein [Pseudomonas protegens]
MNSGEREGCWAAHPLPELVGWLSRQVAGNLVQGILKCKKIIRIFSAELYFLFLGEIFIPRKQKAKAFPLVRRRGCQFAVGSPVDLVWQFIVTPRKEKITKCAVIRL